MSTEPTTHTVYVADEHTAAAQYARLGRHLIVAPVDIGDDPQPADTTAYTGTVEHLLEIARGQSFPHILDSYMRYHRQVSAAIVTDLLDEDLTTVVDAVSEIGVQAWRTIAPYLDSSTREEAQCLIADAEDLAGEEVES